MRQALHPFNTLKEVFDLLPDALVVVDSDGNIMFYNQELSNLLGYSPHELISKPVEVLVPHRSRAVHNHYVADFFRRGLRRKMAAGLPLFALCKDQSEIQVDIALSPYTIGENAYAIAVIREVSEMQYLEQKVGSLRRSKEELEKFACVVSHDLKAPVNRIHALVDMIVKELPEEKSADLSVLVGYLRQSVSLTEKLIAGILEQSRAEYDVGQEPIDLNEILEEVCKSITIPSSISISVPQSLPVIIGKRVQWIQVFMNLITNAVKYNDKDAGILEITWQRDGDDILMNFADNGTVVEPDKRYSIFQMFVRGENRNYSTSHGIGLSIVKKIAEQGGGNIEYAESHLGGSSFKIRWPSGRTR